jgi:hypothetical protein
MLFVLLAWVAQLFLLSGIGWLVYAQLFRLNAPDGWSVRDFFRSFWVGFGVLVAAAQIYSLCLPLKGVFLVLAGCVAAPGLWLQVRTACTRPRASAVPGWRISVFWLLLTICALRLAAGLGTLEWSGAYDSDLYHFGIVRWAKEYPAVPGLANLHAPLGLNSTYLLYAAIMDHGLWYRVAAWVVPGVFIVLFTAQLLWTLLCDVVAAGRTKLLALLLLAFAVLLVCDTLPSLYYDRPATIFLCVALLELVQLAPASASRQEILAGLFTMLLAVAVSVSIKPVGLLAALLLGVLSLAVAWRWPQRAVWLRLFLFPVLLAAGMLARNAVLSGWLLYPAPQGRLPVSWAMPERLDPALPAAAMHSVGEGYRTFRAWARQPGPDYRQVLTGGLWEWLPSWWQRNRHAVELKLLAGGLLFLVLALLPGRRREPLGWLPYAILTCGVLLGFWFFTAPDLRFGEGFFWLWFAVTGALLLTRLAPPRFALAAAGTLAVTALLLAHPRWMWPEKIGWWKIGHALEARYHTVTLNNGQQPPLQVLVPDNDDRMGDAPLPNTPYPLNALRCRVPGNLRHGFYIAQPSGQP